MYYTIQGKDFPDLIQARAEAKRLANKTGVNVHIHGSQIIETLWPEAKKPEWVPALVKYQDVPSWWRMAEQKSKLMGEVILVKVVEAAETAQFEAQYGCSKADYWSKRNDNGGKWYWNKADLILYPDAVEVETYASAKFAHNKGQKKTKAKKPVACENTFLCMCEKCA